MDIVTYALCKKMASGKGEKGDKGDKGDRGEQGLPGQNGQDGITPDIQIGTVTTLEPDQQATVTKRGAKENPIFDFGIPRGADGKGGGSFDDSTISTGKTWSSAKIEDFVLTNDEVVWTNVNGEIANIDYAKEGYLREVEVFGNTIQNEEDLSNIRHLGELYVDNNGEPILDNLGRKQYKVEISTSETLSLLPTKCDLMPQPIVKVHLEEGEKYTIFSDINTRFQLRYFGVSDTSKIDNLAYWASVELPYNSEGKVFTFTAEKSWFKNADYFLIRNYWLDGNLSTEELFKKAKARMFKGTVDLYSNTQEHKALTYEDIYVNPKVSKTTLLLPCQLAKVGNYADKLYWDSKKSRYVIEKNIGQSNLKNLTGSLVGVPSTTHERLFFKNPPGHALLGKLGHSQRKGFVKGLTTDQSSNNSENPVQFVVFHESEFKWYLPKSELPVGYNDHIIKQHAVKLMNDNDYEMYYLLEIPQLIETNITEELKLPTFIDKAYVRVTGGIDGTVKAKAPINGGQAILSLSQKNILLEQENAEIKAINKAQDTEIALNQDAINFILFHSTSMMLSEQTKGINPMSTYLANQIIRGKLSYDLVVEKYEDFKEEIDMILMKKDGQELDKLNK